MGLRKGSSGQDLINNDLMISKDENAEGLTKESLNQVR